MPITQNKREPIWYLVSRLTLLMMFFFNVFDRETDDKPWAVGIVGGHFDGALMAVDDPFGDG